MAIQLRASFLKHTHVGKNTQARSNTASAHLRYISRSTATNYVYSERMPSHYWAAQRFLDDREGRIRKNGRVIDKLIVVFPHGMEIPHAVEAVRRFGFKISLGRTPFYFTLQDFESSNPHAHMIFVDADVETGRRVFKTTDLNSTERLKDAWEAAANDVLDKYGYEFRLDRSAVKELEREIAGKVLEHLANDNEMPPDAPTEGIEPPPEAVHDLDPTEDAQGTQDMDSDWNTRARAARDGLETPAAMVRFAIENGRELEMLRSKRFELSRLQERAESLQAEMSRADLSRSNALNKAVLAADDYRFREEQAERLTRNGKPRGFTLFGWKSKTRQHAEEAIQEREHARLVADVTESSVRDHEASLQRLREEERARQEREVSVYHELRDTYGTDEELDAADQAIETAVKDNLMDISVDQLMEMYATGELEYDDLKSALYLKGAKAELDRLIENESGIEQ